jgi:hypothetical protein
LVVVIWAAFVLVAALDLAGIAEAPAINQVHSMWGGLLLALLSLTAAWSVLGSERWWLRLAVAGCVVGFGWYVAKTPPMNLAVLTVFIAMAVPMAVVRTLGLYLTWDGQPGGSAAGRPLQFSLGRLGLWMVGAALILAAVLRIREMASLGFGELWAGTLFLSVGPAAVVATSFRERANVGQSMATAVGVLAVCLLLVALVFERGDAGVLSTMVTAQFAASALICVAARHAGLRWGQEATLPSVPPAA